MNEVAKVNEYGDTAELSFIGLLKIEDERTVYAYLRCSKHSKRIQADQLIQKHIKRGTTPSLEEKGEIADLLIAAQDEGHSKNFVVGSALDPGKGGNTLIFKMEEHHLYVSLDGAIRGNRTWNMVWLLNNLNKQTSPYSNFEQLSISLDAICKQSPDRIKWIDDLNEDWFGRFR